MDAWIPIVFVLLSAAAHVINAEDVDGGYTEWSDWTACSVTCGRGTMVRVRQCANPSPQGNGRDCESLGPSKESGNCEVKKRCKKRQDVCKVGMDLHVMIDRSRSIPHRVLETVVRRFIPALVGKLKPSKKKTRVTFSLFSRRAYFKLLNNFKEKSSYQKKSLLKLMSKIPDDQRYYTTRIKHALNQVYKGSFNKKKDRKNRQNVLLILGDGNSHPPVKTLLKLATKLRQKKKCHIVAVGYGRHGRQDVAALRELAGQNVILVKKRPAIKLASRKLINKVTKAICAVDGGFSKWTKWSACNASCDAPGVQVHQRYCTRPVPAKGGKGCTGSFYDHQECTGPCTNQ